MAGLDAVLEQLEANIYKNAQHKIRKKDIINAIKFEHKINWIQSRPRLWL